MQQRSNEWLLARCGKFTASSFYKLIGKTITQTAQTYILEKLVEELYGLQEGFETEAMRWGIDYEEEAKEYYELMTGERVQEIAFISPSIDVGGSPDGLIGKSGAIEIKCPFNPINHVKYRLCKTASDLKKLNKANYWQCVGIMWLADREWIDFISYDPRLYGDKKMYLLRIEREQGAERELIAAIERAVEYKKELIKQI